MHLLQNKIYRKKKNLKKNNNNINAFFFFNKKIILSLFFRSQICLYICICLIFNFFKKGKFFK